MYKPHIDGLRALAVVPVVLFHAHVAGFSGGFVGVDVFFVISGYLITGLIQHELAQGTFTLGGFYERRVRRILPALLAMVLVSAVVASVLFIPSDFKDFCRSLIATALLSSNVQFWSEAGYFDAPADLKPLLHTWSLAVEEQYYIVFPLLALMAHRMFPKRFLGCLVALAIVSFAMSVWGVAHAPDAAFYLAPFRVWELLVGALLALTGIRLGGGWWTATAVAGGGVGLIVAAVVGYSQVTPFPGVAALLPCVGAGLVIWACDARDNVVRRGLSWRPLVGIGLVSYSLYLWHWPALVFARYALLRDLTGAEVGVLLAGVGLVSWLSWRYVETPFRVRRNWPRLRVFAGAAVAGVACFAFAKTVLLLHGLPQRLTREATALAVLADKEAVRAPRDQDGKVCPHLDRERRLGRFCVRGAEGVRPNFILTGDSHAGAISGGVFAAAKQLGVAGYQFTHSGFRPLPGVYELGQDRRNALTARFVDFLRSHPEIKLVILTGYWELQATGRSYRHHDIVFRDAGYDGSGIGYNGKSFAGGLKRLLAAFPDRLFAIHEDVPTGWKLDISYAVRVAHIRGMGSLDSAAFGLPRADYEQQRARYLGILKAVAHEARNAHIVPLGDVLCDNATCAGFRGGKLLYVNGDHLSGDGAALFTGHFAKLLGDGLMVTSRSDRR
ncbi:MAG: acyltransferase family protein [Hyphomicrobiaceae bacterium]